MTFARTGRSMKNLEIIARRRPPRRFERLQLRLDLLPGHGRQHAGDDDAVVGRDARGDDPQLADQLADLDGALLDDVVLAGDEHIAPALVGADGAIRNEQHVGLVAERHAHAHEIAGQQRAVGVGQHRATASVPVDAVEVRRRVVEHALVRIAGLVLQADLDRDLLQVLDAVIPRLPCWRGCSARPAR